MAEYSRIARPYAQAIFELARDSGQLDAWSDLLHTAAATVSDPGVSRLVDSPEIDNQKIVELVIGICSETVSGAAGNAEQLSNLMKLLAENGRLPALPEIAVLFDKLKADVENSIDIVLTAASPVGPDQQAKIVDALRRGLTATSTYDSSWMRLSSAAPVFRQMTWL